MISISKSLLGEKFVLYSTSPIRIKGISSRIFNKFKPILDEKVASIIDYYESLMKLIYYYQPIIDAIYEIPKAEKNFQLLSNCIKFC